MDFFAEQDAAHRNSRWLIVLFVLAVLAIILTLYLTLIAIIAYSDNSRMAAPLTLWQPDLFFGLALTVSTVILLSSLFKVIQLSNAGGAKVAEALDGRLIARATHDHLEQRLLNVVDEMAIASGIPVPRVYVLDHESAINAFAAGNTSSDAVIAVTRGALEQLNRDELLGVIAHEFSHIFNGDMRLNIRLMGVLHGILMLTLIGRVILRGSSHSRSSSGRKGAGGIVLFALALFVIGYIGIFFGRLIKASLSRQREFLADASAVQFTRNPGGIAGALKKIAGLDSTLIQHPDAESASHMFFGNGINSFLSLLATHPPVEERISRLDPYFKMDLSLSSAAPSVATAAMGFAAETTAQTVRASVGNMGGQQLDYAQKLMQRLPEALLQQLRQPHSAHALVLALVKDNSPGHVLQTALPQGSAVTADQILAVVELLKDVDRADWLALLELAVPALEELPQNELAAIPAEVDALIHADKRVTPFEFALATFLRHTLKARGPLAPQRRSGGRKQLLSDVAQLLSLLVHAGHNEQEMAQKAFKQAVITLGGKSEMKLQNRDQISLKSIEQALERLARQNFRFKGRIIEAASAAIIIDGEIKPIELDFLRAIAACLDCPMPVLIGQGTARQAP